MTMDSNSPCPEHPAADYANARHCLHGTLREPGTCCHCGLQFVPAEDNGDAFHDEYGVAHGTNFHALTPREVQVIQLVAHGKAYKEIAKKLHVSFHTAKFHVQNILDKLDAENAAHAAAIAVRRGIVT